MTFKAAIAAAAVLLAHSAAAHAQNYPTRAITVVVGLPAGSGGDVVARFYADKLSRSPASRSSSRTSPA